MTRGGFYEPRKMSPTGLAVVIAMHAAALGALALMKGPEFVKPFFPDTELEFIPLEEDPPENPPVEPKMPAPQRPTQIDLPPQPFDFPPVAPPVTSGRSDPPVWDFTPPGDQVIPPTRVDPPPPVRVDAELDPRYAGDLQPPYPPGEERAGREGSVRLRLTIGADGRVKNVQRLNATSDAFWRATERHAKARWRFRPATLDGRPIESSKTMTVHFRIPE